MTGDKIPHDLDGLEARHADEEQTEAQRDLTHGERLQRMSRPPGGVLTQSDAWLARLYAGDRIVREKKPGVFDHLRSAGAWFVSVDEPPLAVLDGMSQTATLAAGFAADPIVKAYVDGGFGETLLYADDTSHGAHAGHWALEAYADELRARVPGLPHVTFVNSGAESLEKAFALCRLQHPSRSRVFAFEGSFHGRTLLSLHASFNPKKRAPYELPGYEVTFAPFPKWSTPAAGEPGAPDGWLASVAIGKLDALDAGDDALLAAELETLRAVQASLSEDVYFAVAIEPMQSEGGDRYATARFFQALRLLTRHHDVPLVVDEVQTGFGLGGTFAWHRRFGFVDAAGESDGPDCVTFAKRAQLGIVMSRFADPEPSSTHTASAVRGLIHARLAAEDGYAAQVEGWTRDHLATLAGRYPDLVHAPRATGYACAFDLPTPAHLGAFLAQRWWRGAIVFGAGDRTVRYRFGVRWSKPEIDRLFEAVHRSLKWMEAHPDEQPPSWVDPHPSPKEAVARRSDAPTRVRIADATEADVLVPRILELEAEAYEPARRDSEETLRRAFADGGVAVVAEAEVGGEWLVVGNALAAPLEHFSDVDGPNEDPHLGQHDTLYAMAQTVAEAYRGLGLGHTMKAAQIARAAELMRDRGAPRYRHISGRNRVPDAAAMQRLNQRFGAYEVARYEGQYDDAGTASYYRLPVGPFLPAASTAHRADDALDLMGGLARPFETAPASLVALRDRGALYGPAVNKLTICNYVTPAVVRALEWVGALSPAHPHLFLTSSRDEAFDKAFRILKHHRGAATVALGLAGGYVGHTTAAARSMSDPEVHAAGPAHFDGFLRVPHPANDDAASLAALREEITARGAEGIVGIFVEPVQERTGRVLPASFLSGLAALRDETGVPVVFMETASASYRSGCGPFFASGVEGFTPDLVAWWGGGQIGFIHVRPEWNVPTPLTMVSTWDGDELSMIRVHHQLRAARRLDVGALDAGLTKALAPLAARYPALGVGAYRVVQVGDEAEAVAGRLAAAGVRVRVFPQGALGFVPPLDAGADALARLERAVAEVV